MADLFLANTNSEDDDDFIPETARVPRPARFAEGRPTGEATILAQADGRLGYNQMEPPEGQQATVDYIQKSRNPRDMPNG